MYNFIISGFSDEICCDFEDQLKTVKEIGLTHISIRGLGKENIDGCSLEKVENYVKPLLKKYEVNVSSIGSSIGKIPMHEVQSEKDFNKYLDHVEHVAKIAEILDTTYIRFFSFFIPEDDDPFKYSKEIIDKINKIVNIFERYSLTGLLENEQNTYGDTAARGLELMKNIDNTGFAALFDFANYLHCGEDPLECYKIMKPYIRYFHVKDAKFGNRDSVICGSGDGKIAEILQMAADDGYNGFLTLEPHLVPFQLLKSLELDTNSEIESDNIIHSGKRLFVMQFNALREIMDKIKN
jgi:sugar phosphate isomerase/epimerase